ncbi:MAG: PilZ domain-containing protein [Candidatus Omnitrophota bacterium]
MEKDKFVSFERRKFLRLEKNLFITYCLESNTSDKVKAIAKNISGGGLMFETERDIPPGSKLELEIHQPIKHSKDIIFSIATLARVIWSRNIKKESFEQGENKYRIGVEFLEIKKEDRQKIASYAGDGTLE